MEKSMIQKYLHEDLVKAIITQSLVSFNENYINIEDNEFKYDNVSLGLKLKPVNLSKHLFSDILYSINKDYNDVYRNNTDTNLYEYIKEAILVKDEILELVNHKDFYQYISYCFTSLTFTSYLKYLNVLKRKIFDFYGEITVHHYSYLKKSKIEGPLNIKELDTVEAIKFFNENRKLYWLAASFRVFSEENKEKDSLTVLRDILIKNGLSKKGWVFLINQSEHYITRFAQSLNVGIFCANFKLKDAWLRNRNLKEILSLVVGRRLYVYLGCLCKNWGKPVSKFSYLNTEILKMLSIESCISFKQEVSSMTARSVLSPNDDAFRICADYIRAPDSYCYNPFRIFCKRGFYDVILTDVEKKIKSLGKKYQTNNILLTEDSAYYRVLTEILNENNLKAYINFSEYSNITLKKLKENFSTVIIDALKKHENKIFQNEINNCINMIREKFGNNIFMYVKEFGIERDIFSHEFSDNDLFIKNYDENPYMVQEAIVALPFSGNSYISEYRDFLRKNGVTKSAWKNIHHLYKKEYTTICRLLEIKNIVDDIEKVVHFFNNKIDVSNYYLYQYLLWQNYNFRFSCENKDIKQYNLNLLFIHLIRKMQTPSLTLEKGDFLLNFIPENRKKMYERIVERGQGQGRGGILTPSKLAERDFQSMIDYLSILENKVNYKSVNGILEASIRWHEQSMYNNLPYKIFKEESVGHVIIDKKYEFKQLLNTDELRNESDVMHHCVAGYNIECAKNEYIVYHMSNIHNSEKATLGIKKDSEGYTFSQMYAEYNNFISEEEINAGKYIVNCLNGLHSETFEFSEDEKGFFVMNLEEDEIIF